MKTTQALAAVAWLFPLVALAADHGDMTHSSAAPSTTPVHGDNYAALGCYKVNPKTPNPISADGSGDATTNQFNTEFSCMAHDCLSYRYSAVMAGNKCFCSNTLPADLIKADDKECNVGCFGFNPYMCGGVAAVNLWENNGHANGGMSTVASSSISTTAKPIASGSSNHTESAASSTTTKGPASSDPVKAGASALVAQSWAFLAGVGAVFFL